MTELNGTLMSAGGDAAAIIEAATAAAALEDQVQQFMPESGPFLVRRPAGVAVDLVDPEKYAMIPYRKRGHVKVTDAESLCQYVNTHTCAGTTLWADRDSGRIVAVLDDHDGSDPGWGEHRATMTLRKTTDWALWSGNDGQMMEQSTFAELIEDGAGAIVSPVAAEMLELAQTFHAARSVNFKSGKHLSSGETQLVYDEAIDASGGRTGQLRIPDTFKLGLSPFEGTEAFAIQARLRYRLSGPKLLLGYKLNRPDELVRQAFDAVLKLVAEKTEITPHNGTAR